MPRADIIVDKYLVGVKERPLEFIDTGAYLVQCDIKSLPFKDKTIDFAFSSHTIEHLSEIKICLDEISRVAKRGFIACPSALREQLIPIRTHLWFIEKKKDTLLIKSKTKPYPQYVDNFTEKVLASPDCYVLYDLERKFANQLIINYFWKDKINYSLIDKETNSPFWKNEGENLFGNRRGILLWWRTKIIVLSSRLQRFLKSDRRFDIKEILCCPVCHGDFLYKENSCICTKCRHSFLHKKLRVFRFT